MKEGRASHHALRKALQQAHMNARRKSTPQKGNADPSCCPCGQIVAVFSETAEPIRGASNRHDPDRISPLPTGRIISNRSEGEQPTTAPSPGHPLKPSAWLWYHSQRCNREAPCAERRAMCRAIGFRNKIAQRRHGELIYPARATFPRCTPSRVCGIIPPLAETPTPQLKRGLAVARTGNSIRCTCNYGRPRAGSPSSSDSSSRSRCGIIRSGTTTGGRVKKSIWTDERIAAVKARNRVERIYRCRRHGADALGFRKGDTFVVAAGSVCGPRDKRIKKPSPSGGVIRSNASARFRAER